MSEFTKEYPMNCIGQLIVTEQTCDDSFAWARQLLPMASDGTVLIARNLTKARGRQGRTWVLAEGQITHTIILKPEAFPAHVLRDAANTAPQDERYSSINSYSKATLTHSAHPEEARRAVSKDMSGLEQDLATLNMALTLGLWQPLQKFAVTLKWPNDLYLNDKKLGGMLFENVWHDNTLVGVILGYSININNSCQHDDRIKNLATSLSDATGKQHDLGALQIELFASLSKFYDQWKEGLFQDIFQLWRRQQGYLGKQVQVHNRDGSLLEGIAQDVLPNGDLVLNVVGADRTAIITFSQVEEVRI